MNSPLKLHTNNTHTYPVIYQEHTSRT